MPSGDPLSPIARQPSRGRATCYERDHSFTQRRDETVSLSLPAQFTHRRATQAWALIGQSHQMIVNGLTVSCIGCA